MADARKSASAASCRSMIFRQMWSLGCFRGASSSVAIVAAGASLVAWLAAGPAQAAPPAAAASSKIEEARALYNQGLRHYNLTEYDKAIQSFKTAYELSS